jgi:hypothetical protein
MLKKNHTIKTKYKKLFPSLNRTKIGVEQLLIAFRWRKNGVGHVSALIAWLIRTVLGGAGAWL